MKTFNLCLVRHGETDWNVENRVQGQLDLPLNSKGLNQAEALLAVVQKMHFDAVYSSDLSRASTTAVPLAQHFGLELKKKIGLRERHYGAFQGFTYEEIGRKDPDALRRFRAREPDFDMGGGESLNMLRSRCLEQLEFLAFTHPGQTVLAVTHGAVLDTVFRILTNQSIEESLSIPTPNCALNWMRFDQGQWHLEVWGDKDHVLDALDALPD